MIIIVKDSDGFLIMDGGKTLRNGNDEKCIFPALTSAESYLNAVGVTNYLPWVDSEESK